MPVDNPVFKVRIVWSNATSGENLSCVLHGDQSELDAPNITAIGDDVKAWWSTEVHDAKTGMKHYVTEDIALELVTLQRVDPLEPIEFQYTTGLPIAGTDTGEPGRPQDCVLASMRTEKIGRSYRGRMYLPTPAEAYTENGNLIDTEAATLADFVVILIGLLEADGFRTGIYSQQHNGEAVTAFNVVTNVLVDQRLRTQRRRTNRTPIYSAGS